MTILCIRLSALGDVAMTLPAIYSAAQRYPESRFYVLVTERFAQLFIHRPHNLEIIPFRREEHRSVSGFVGLIRELRRLGITHVADLHNVGRSWRIAMALRLCGARVAMLDKKRRERNAILQHRQQETRPFTLRYFDVFERLGLPCKDTFEGFRLRDEEFALPPFVPAKEEGERWIGIAAFARYESKRYPLELMQQLLEGLCREEHTRIFLFGGGDEERRRCEAWSEGHPQVYSLPGRMTLMQEMHLMQHLDIMVSMDSANQHIASLVGTPVITLWGGTTPACGFSAWRQRPENQLVAALPCQPCSIAGTTTCPLHKDFACLRALSPLELLSP